jgi:hypothetical protein
MHENDTENIPLFLVASRFVSYDAKRTRSALRSEPLARSSSISWLALPLLTHGVICGREPERHGATRSVRKIAAMTRPHDPHGGRYSQPYDAKYR